MKLIKPNVEEWHCGYTLPEIWSHIAKCARVCYQSEPHNSESDEEFVKRVILRNHSFDEIAENRDLQLKLRLSVLEHGTVYLELPKVNYVAEFYKAEPHSKIYIGYIGNDKPSVYITTNIRVMVEHGRINDSQYICTPTKYHYLRSSFNIITDIGIARELAEHRTHSISEEYTRYCNYSKDKFNNELTFIIPEWLNIPSGEYNSQNLCELNINIRDDSNGDFTSRLDAYYFLYELLRIEKVYLNLIKSQTPQQVRQILPLSTKVQTIHTAFNSDWEEFVKLRADACSGSVHPNMRVIANKIKNLMSQKIKYESIKEISICVTYDSYKYYSIRD